MQSVAKNACLSYYLTLNNLKYNVDVRKHMVYSKIFFEYVFLRKEII